MPQTGLPIVLEGIHLQLRATERDIKGAEEGLPLRRWREGRIAGSIGDAQSPVSCVVANCTAEQ